MILEKIEYLMISGNAVEDANVEESLHQLKDKVNECVDELNFLQGIIKALLVAHPKIFNELNKKKDD